MCPLTGVISDVGRLAQRESTALTTQGSLVRSQYRPPYKGPGRLPFARSNQRSKGHLFARVPLLLPI
jgi:hypothetical protein